MIELPKRLLRMTAFGFGCLAILPISKATAQSGRYRSLATMDSIRAASGAIYGTFIQRLGFSSGGFSQDIELVELTTSKRYRFPVKPTFKSARENFFSHRLPAGTYAIMTYNWTRSTWYGGKVFAEPIYKNGSNAAIDSGLQSGALKPEDLRRFTFTVQPRTLTYVGTWHFDKEPASFTDDKDEVDREHDGDLKRLKIESRSVAIPN